MNALNLFKNTEHYEVFPANHILFREGELGRIMYVVVAGEVEIVYRGRILETVKEGGILGEMAMTSHHPRSATAFTRTECKLVPMELDQFNYLISQTPFFAQTILQIMSERMRKMNVQVLTSLTRPV